MRRLSIAAVPALAMALAGTAAAQNGFDGIVRSLETEYGVQRFHNPLFGLAKVIVNVARPHGVTDFDLALFEDHHLGRSDRARFYEIVRSGVGPDWRPMINIRSRRDGEYTAIFVKGSGKRMRLLLATCDRGDAVVIQMKLDGETFSQWLEEPDEMGDRMMNDSER